MLDRNNNINVTISYNMSPTWPFITKLKKNLPAHRSIISFTDGPLATSAGDALSIGIWSEWTWKGCLVLLDATIFLHLLGTTFSSLKTAILFP